MDKQELIDSGFDSIKLEQYLKEREADVVKIADDLEKDLAFIEAVKKETQEPVLHTFRLIYNVRGKDECYFADATDKQAAIEQIHKDWHRTKNCLVECTNLDRL